MIQQSRCDPAEYIPSRLFDLHCACCDARILSERRHPCECSLSRPDSVGSTRCNANQRLLTLISEPPEAIRISPPLVREPSFSFLLACLFPSNAFFAFHIFKSRRGSPRTAANCTANSRRLDTRATSIVCSCLLDTWYLVKREGVLQPATHDPWRPFFRARKKQEEPHHTSHKDKEEDILKSLKSSHLR